MKTEFEYEQEIEELMEELAMAERMVLVWKETSKKMFKSKMDVYTLLTAAEQRNAELVESLKSAIEWFDDGVGRSDAEFDFIQSMKATLKPTESGASK